jgi:hypothetical protein
MKPIDKLLVSQKNFVDDIDKHFKNKRLKKNIFKLEGIMN